MVESKAQGETREAYLRSYNRSQEPYCSSTVLIRDDCVCCDLWPYSCSWRCVVAFRDVIARCPRSPVTRQCQYYGYRLILVVYLSTNSAW